MARKALVTGQWAPRQFEHTQVGDSQASRGGLRLERHEDDAIDYQGGLSRPFSVLDQAPENGTSQDQMSSRADRWPQDEKDRQGLPPSAKPPDQVGSYLTSVLVYMVKPRDRPVTVTAEAQVRALQ